MNTPTPTPRTDAATYPADCLGKTLVTNRDCARELETELVTLTAAYTCTHHNDAERTACPVCLVAALTAERDQLRAERDQLAALFPHICTWWMKRYDAADRQLCEKAARAEKAEAELTTERARVDYLGKCDGAFDHIRWGDYRHYWGKGFGSLREIVDAAMKEGAK